MDSEAKHTSIRCWNGGKVRYKSDWMLPVRVGGQHWSELDARDSGIRTYQDSTPSIQFLCRHDAAQARLRITRCPSHVRVSTTGTAIERDEMRTHEFAIPVQGRHVRLVAFRPRLECRIVNHVDHFGDAGGGVDNAGAFTWRVFRDSKKRR